MSLQHPHPHKPSALKTKCIIPSTHWGTGDRQKTFSEQPLRCCGTLWAVGTEKPPPKDPSLEGKAGCELVDILLSQPKFMQLKKVAKFKKIVIAAT